MNEIKFIGLNYNKFTTFYIYNKMFLLILTIISREKTSRKTLEILINTIIILITYY